MTLQPLLDLINLVPRDWILPPANLFLLIALGLLLRRRWRRAGTVLGGISLALLALFSTTGGARLLVAPLEAMSTPLRAPEQAGAQAIVVLASGRLQRAPEYGDRDIPDYIALARVRYGAHLQRRTGLPLLVSGGNGASGVDPAVNDRAYVKADAMATALREDFGVAVQWVERHSRDTNENASDSAVLLRAAGVQRILLVTDAMHMPRSCAAFERAGLDVVNAPTMFFSKQAQGSSSWVPGAEGMRRSRYALYEWMGSIWYRLRADGKDGREAAIAAKCYGS
ncbi:YdcF family protein [Massilia brevitalea]|uniref:YdcF family protein n=1 Tax=Massilia brevitalea TaxID=442526 RepID=UPI002739D656|nr:YdcF family protein [Massilia brevitalea]